MNITAMDPDGKTIEISDDTIAKLQPHLDAIKKSLDKGSSSLGIDPDPTQHPKTATVTVQFLP